MEATSNKKEIMIDLESPRSRYMDMSPNKLSEELECSINTVKNRLQALGLDFSIHNSGDYQLYNYECLPILKAYLNIKRSTQENHNNITAFLERIDTELNEDSDQVVCQSFLYNQKYFQDYLLQSKLEGPIEQRLSCIKDLSQKYSIQADSKSPSAVYIQSMEKIIEHLDRMIYELSNNELPDITDVQTHTEKKTQRLTTSLLTTDWCKNLLERRKKITKDGQIQFGNVPPDADKIKLLNQILMEKAFSEEEKEYSNNLSDVLNRVRKHQAFAKKMNEEELNILQKNVHELLQYNFTEYMKATLNFHPAPDFFPDTDKCSLNPMIKAIVRETYETVLYATARLVQQFTGLQVRYLVEQAYSAKTSKLISPDPLHQLQSLLKATEETIRNFWDVIIESLDPTLADKPLKEIYCTAIDSVGLCEEKFSVRSHKEECIEIFEELLQKTDVTILSDFHKTMIAGAVTLEFFLQKCSEYYSSSICKSCRNYQDTLSLYIDS